MGSVALTHSCITDFLTIGRCVRRTFRGCSLIDPTKVFINNVSRFLQNQLNSSMKLLSTFLLPLLPNAAAADTWLGGWRSDLPWDVLDANLSSGASLIDTTPIQYLDECAPEFDKPLDPTWISNPARSNQ